MVSFLREERKGLRQNLNNAGGGSSTGRMGNVYRNRGAVIRSRIEYDSNADEEGAAKRRIGIAESDFGKLGIQTEKSEGVLLPISSFRGIEYGGFLYIGFPMCIHNGRMQKADGAPTENGRVGFDLGLARLADYAAKLEGEFPIVGAL